MLVNDKASKMITYVFLSILSVVLCQYPLSIGIKPDVTFGDENERFDISSVIKYQNRFYGIDEDFRRAENAKEGLLLNALKNTIDSMRRSDTGVKNTVELFRRSDTDFAYHDTMDRGGGTVEDFEINLKKFKKEADEYKRKLKAVVEDEGQDGRRSNPDAESEVLMNHAMPVQLNVQGYFQLPLNE